MTDIDIDIDSTRRPARKIEVFTYKKIYILVNLLMFLIRQFSNLHSALFITLIQSYQKSVIYDYLLILWTLWKNLSNTKKKLRIYEA